MTKPVAEVMAIEEIFRLSSTLRVSSSDTVLQEHFENAPRNGIYRNKTIQNDLIRCCRDVLRIQIVDEVKEAIIYSITADETPDI